MAGSGRSQPLAHVRAVAAAEFRLARRMVRTWVFAFIAVAGGLFTYHLWSGPATWGATASPRFALPGLGMLSLWVLLVGLVFLAFDIRARDERERIVEVLDARPLRNIAVLVGRLVAVVAIAWLPLVVLAILLQASGMVVDYQNWPVGVPAEPVSLATFVFLDAPPALVFWCALVMLLAAALRNRLAVSLIALSLIAVGFWALFNTPLYLLPVVSGIANLGLPGSDILPRGPSLEDVVQRLCVLTLGAGLVTVAAALLPRRDSRSRTPYLAWGAALVVLGGAGIAGLVVHAVSLRAERVVWAEVHSALQTSARPDLERISGNVVIDPGRELAIALDLEMRAPDAAPLADFLFSLNPGMRVESVQMDGTGLEFEHDSGVLRVRPGRPLSPGERADMSIRARGIPDPRFGYLDSAVWALDETLLGMPIVLLGEQASLFDSRYVALAPAVCWLPKSGANFGVENPAVQPPDSHHIDLTVEIPDGWHVVGPGREVRDGGLRFRPGVALAEFPLIAAPLERRALPLDDVEYELLIHRKHLANVEYFSAEEKLETVANYIRSNLRAIPGLRYPHRVMSLVEVPAQLRRYRGGRLLDAVQAWPGIQMLPEHGLPTRRLEARPRYGSPTDDMVLQMDLAYAGRGPHGVPLRAGASRNLLPFLTSATGEGAFAANYLLQSLTAWRFGNQRTVAPGHWLQLGLAPGSPFPLRVMHRLTGTATFSFNWYLFFPMALEDRSAGYSFTNFDPNESTAHADVLIHKGNLIALAVQGLMGREKVGEFLALMRERHAGSTFGLDDFIAAMTETDPAMAPYIEHFMRESTLPGFLASDLRAYRIADDENGQPRYQLAVHIRNDEPVPGVAAIAFWSSLYQWGDFVHVPGKTSLELGVVASEPPAEVRLETYLSQNRRIMRLALPPIDPETTLPGEPFNGSRHSDWTPQDSGIVVDDLDPGFATVSPPRRGFRMSFGDEEDDTDGGVPEYYSDAGARLWRRQENPDTVSWGKYRRTLTRIQAGDGEGRASFRAELPTPGTWRLSYHLPGSSASEGNRFQLPSGWESGDRFGTLDFEIVAGASRTPFIFDASTAVSGWNDLGTFDLAAGPVTVVVSDDTTGDIVVADAIRWAPVSNAGTRPVDGSTTGS
ncbi:MAG: hypothetical protein OXH68_01480 [Gammaproteobacteria bacterium]|nr:hypothetical protein [Gammaproteobacteria bacterium]